MNYRQSLAVALPIFLGASLALTACDASSSAEAEGKKYVIGISNPQAAQPVLSTVEEAIGAAAKRDGISIKALDAQLNPSKQVTDIDQLIAQKVDALIVYPLDANSLTPALNRARAAGIKIIGWGAQAGQEKTVSAPYDTNLDTGGAHRGAELLAEFVKKELNGQGNALGVGLGVPVPALQLMVKNYESGVTENSSIKWMGTVDNPSDDIAGAQRVVADALTRYKNDVQAVLAYNDSSATGAGIALKNAGINGAIVVGQNGDDEGAAAVADGRISATIDLVPWRQGIILETLAKALIDGKEVPTWSENPSEIYTKDTIESRLGWKTALEKITSGELSCSNGGGCPQGVADLR